MAESRISIFEGKKIRKHWDKEQNEYAILTNIIHQEWSDLSVKEHKDLKRLKTQNLRDHMTDAELVFTALNWKESCQRVKLSSART